MAVGCIGLSLDDFCKLGYGEFESICKAWREMREDECRDAWERARTVAAISIQPHIKKKITPVQLLPLPWDKKTKIRSKAPRPTAEVRHKRFEEIVHRLGDEINP
ncbi:hypothetical protein [uncultured Muribaculum sp.]|uniref:hypothetical protein n=1 Tax=uncultured Muribaculum sp. TaxID=1918613 RepID=UPI00266FC961|nr:hypothetical protein [uncultured Muribaculum sp.]